MKTTKADRVRALAYHVGEADVDPDITRWVETGANEKDVDPDILRLANEFAEVRAESRKAPTYESARTFLSENIKPIDPKLPALDREILSTISDQWWTVAGLLDEAHEKDRAIRALFKQRLTPLMSSDTPAQCWTLTMEFLRSISALEQTLRKVEQRRRDSHSKPKQRLSETMTVAPKKVPASMLPTSVPPTRRSIKAADQRVKKAKAR